MKQESKIAVVYARYSSDKQNEQSIDGQLSVVESFAEKEGYTMIDKYIDRAISGRSDDRPSFQKMIEDSKKKQFQYVIVYKLDRFSRDRYDSAIYKRALKNNGVKVISATENIGDNPESIILESMLEGYSEYYSRELAQKVKRGNRESRKKGFYTGGAIPYGYMVMDKKYIIEDNEAKIVKEIFNKSLSGIKMVDIANDLNSRHIPYKNGDKWDIDRIKRTLSNEKYIGIARFGNDIYDNIVPQIIDEAVFEKVRKQCAKRKHGSKRKDMVNEYILSGKLFCAKCGSSIIGRSGKRSPNNDRYRYYVCNRRIEHKCDLSNTRKEELENEVASIVYNYVYNGDIDDMANQMVSFYNTDENKGELSVLNSQLEEINKKLINTMKAIQNGFYSEMMNGMVSDLEEEKRGIENRIKNLKSNDKLSITFEECKDYLLTIKKTTSEFSKESLIKYMVKAVYIDDDYIKVTLYPSNDPIVRSRKDKFEIASANKTEENISKIIDFTNISSKKLPWMLEPPNVNRTLNFKSNL